jgi:Na+/H+-dicarboxylate symporter
MNPLIASQRVSWLVLGALVAGVIAGLTLEMAAAPHAVAVASSVFVVVSTIFLNMVKMVVGPLIFATLTHGIANAGDGKVIARIGAKAMLWFLVASIFSLGIGAAGAIVLHPGVGMNLVSHETLAGSGLTSELSVAKTLTNAFPTSVVDALAKNSILQIVVFSIFAGVGLSGLGPRANLINEGLGQLAALMLRITNYVMLFAPLAVFAAVANVIMTQGAKVMGSFLYLIAGYYAALALLVIVLLAVGWSFLGRDLARLLKLLREPVVLAFSTSSSEAAYPKILASLEAFGVPRRIASFVLPLGYSFNLDASMLYCTFGALFVAQAYNIHLAGGTIVLLLLTLMLASKGIAAVPRGALIALAAVLPQFNLPADGILLLLGVDHFMNMGRSGANVIGNALAVVAVSRWEGELEGEAHAPDAPDGVES